MLSALLRFTVKEMVGERISIPDRLARALLGAARVGLLAVVMVLVFDRIIPPGYDPAFLQGSKWRPALSKAWRKGPAVAAAGGGRHHRPHQARTRTIIASVQLFPGALR